jgi:hypothetical protein
VFVNSFKYLFVFSLLFLNISLKSSHDPDSEKSSPLHRVGSLQTWKSQLFNGAPLVTIDLDVLVRSRRERKARINELKDSFGSAGSNDDDEEVKMEQARASAAQELFMEVPPAPAVRGGSIGSEGGRSSEEVVQGSDPALVETLCLPMRRRSVSEASPLRKSDLLSFDEFSREKSAPSTLRIKEDLPQRRPSTPKAVVSEIQPAPKKKSASPETPKSKPKPRIGGSVTPRTLKDMDYLNATAFMDMQRNLMGSVFDGKKAPKDKVRSGWRKLFSRGSVKRTDDSDDDS